MSWGGAGRDQISWSSESCSGLYLEGKVTHCRALNRRAIQPDWSFRKLPGYRVEAGLEKEQDWRKGGQF